MLLILLTIMMLSCLSSIELIKANKEINTNKFSIKIMHYISKVYNKVLIYKSMTFLIGMRLKSKVTYFFMLDFNNYHPETLDIPLSSRPPVTSSALFLSPTSHDWRALGRVT